MPMKNTMQVSAHTCAYAHVQLGYMARVRSAQQMRWAIALGILYMLVDHADAYINSSSSRIILIAQGGTLGALSSSCRKTNATS